MEQEEISIEKIRKLIRTLEGHSNPHCVFIALIRGDKCPNCNLCNNDLCSVCTLEDYTRIFSK